MKLLIARNFAYRQGVTSLLKPYLPLYLLTMNRRKNSVLTKNIMDMYFEVCDCIGGFDLELISIQTNTRLLDFS